MQARMLPFRSAPAVFQSGMDIALNNSVLDEKGEKCLFPRHFYS